MGATKVGRGELGEAEMRRTRSRVWKWRPVGGRGRGDLGGSVEVHKAVCAEMVGGSSCMSTLNTRLEAGTQAQLCCSLSSAFFFFLPFFKAW